MSDLEHEAPIQIHQEVNIWVSEVEANRDLDFDILKNRQAYLIQLEGESMINNIAMSEKDGMEIFEEPIKIKTVRPSLFMIIEMNINGK